MMFIINNIKYFLLLSSMILAIIGQMLLKKGINLSSLTPDVESIIKTILSPFVFFGFFSYAVSSIIWLFILQKFPLSVAYPALSLTYVIVVILSYLFLKEPLTLSKMFGIILIVSGVLLIFK